MPSILAVKQFIADSTRAWYYYNLTKDSSYIQKFFRRGQSQPKKDTVKPKTSVVKSDTQKPQQRDPGQTGFRNREVLWDPTRQEKLFKKWRDIA
jgi:transposase